MERYLLLAFHSFFLMQSVSYGQGCCCGPLVELVFPGFDFELDPLPPYNQYITKCNGELGPWVITAYCVDHCDAYYYGASLGNPNGPSSFPDLYGGPPGFPSGSAHIQYPLTGLIPGSTYIIEWYSAKFDVPVKTTIKGRCKIEGGAWLNVAWIANNKGNIIWLKQSHIFTAQATSTILEFSDDGSISPGWASGMLIDDIKIFGCSATDMGNPIINNPPNNFVVECISDVPQVPSLDVTDDCDTSPVITFKETFEIIAPCKKITRDWTVTDDCGNSVTAKQVIDIIDQENPVINNPPDDLVVGCIKDIPNVPNLDITDNCDLNPVVVFKETTEIIAPCRKITREWTVTDECGNSTLATQIIEVIDDELPTINNPPIDLTVGCDKDVPKVPTLNASDNCDVNLTVTFKESTEIINSCTKKIKRVWNTVDACGNIGTANQIIDIIDQPAIVVNPPEDAEVICDKYVPIAPTLDIHDDCSIKPTVVFTETTENIDACTKRLIRDWIITDACGNITTENQIIDIVDLNPPRFTKPPENKLINCNKDILKEFNDWIRKQGNAIAKDTCGVVAWLTNYDRLPKNYCDTVLVEFIAMDHCGNQISNYANFIVIDTSAPKFIVKAESKNYVCISNTRDSLRKWLSNYGFSKLAGECDTVIRSSNFNGDSTKNPMQVTFYAKDRCGNIDSSKASFSYRSSNDTLRVTDKSCHHIQNSIDTLSFIVNGCDSIVIVEKIKHLSDSTYLQSNTCDPQQKKFDTIPLISVTGCDSLIFHEYIFHSSPIITLQKSDCSYFQYSKDSTIHHGQFCDSLVITEYFPLRKDINTVTISTCDQTEADTVVYNLTNSVGCDSLVTVYTIYTPQKMTFHENKICGLQNSFLDTVKYNIGLCDSLVITTHIALPLDSTYIQSSSCDKSKAGIFSSTLTNQYGCDSLVVQEILLNPSDSIFILNSTCDVAEAGIKWHLLKNRFGCDSTVQISTSFIPSDTTRITQNTCKQSEAGSDTLIYAVTNCDSVVFLTTVFIPSDTSHISQTTCNLADAGLKTLIVKGVQCDSLIFSTTVFVPSDTTILSKTTCNPTTAGLSKTVLQNRGGCDSLILINTTFIPLQLNFELDSISCFNLNDGIFRIINSSDFTKPLELFLNDNSLGNQNQITNLRSGSYRIYVRDQKGCITDSVEFTLTNPEDLIIDLGNDQEVKKGTLITLNLQSNKTLRNIFWSPSGISNCNNCSTINTTIYKDTWIYTQAIDERGCDKNDSLLIRVKKSGSVHAPNSFTPNGDNINDYFYILGDANSIVEILFIYDRWGNKVFETFNVPVNDHSSGWNGTFQSQKMNPGVFVYYAKVRKDDGDVVELKGDVTLIR